MIELNIKKPLCFIQILKAANMFLKEGVLVFNNNLFQMKELTPEKDTLFFSNYYDLFDEKIKEPIIFKIILDNLLKILKTFKNGYSLTLFLDDNMEKLKIVFSNSQKKKITHKSNLLGFNKDNYLSQGKLLDTLLEKDQDDNFLALYSDDLNNLNENLNIYKDKIGITGDKKTQKIIFSASDLEMGNCQYELTDKSGDIKDLKLKNNFNMAFPNKKFNNICKISKTLFDIDDIYMEFFIDNNSLSIIYKDKNEIDNYTQLVNTSLIDDLIEDDESDDESESETETDE